MYKEVDKAELKKDLIEILTNLDPEDIIQVEGTHQPMPNDLPIGASWDWNPEYRKLTITIKNHKTNG